jgi:hypothetical protein
LNAYPEEGVRDDADISCPRHVNEFDKEDDSEDFLGEKGESREVHCRIAIPAR